MPPSGLNNYQILGLCGTRQPLLDYTDHILYLVLSEGEQVKEGIGRRDVRIVGTRL